MWWTDGRTDTMRENNDHLFGRGLVGHFEGSRLVPSVHSMEKYVKVMAIENHRNIFHPGHRCKKEKENGVISDPFWPSPWWTLFLLEDLFEFWKWERMDICWNNDHNKETVMWIKNEKKDG